MQTEEYAKMYHLEDSYWWFQGRKTIVAGLLERLPAFQREDARILDLGCGTGLMLEYLNHRHWSVGLDFSPLALEFSRKRGVRRVLRGDVGQMPIAGESFDVVTALDLAEHVERDDLFFSEVRRVLKPEGRMILTVPAHPFLWSDHDEALHHFRRYTKKELRSKILAAGFQIERLSYCITFTYPPIVAFRALQRLFRKSGRPKTHVIELPGLGNSLLKISVNLEAHLLKWTNLPFGITLLADARKNK